jgi:hypothetical protein
VVNKKQKPFRLVNVSGVLIHHVASEPQFGDQRLFSMNAAQPWLISGFHAVAGGHTTVPAVNFVLNRFCLKRRVSEVGGVPDGDSPQTFSCRRGYCRRDAQPRND